MPFTDYTPEEISWASKTAMKLRVHQADFADQAPEERRALLDDVVKQEMKNILPEKRPRFARALAEHFPTGTITVAKPVESEPTDNSPEALVEALVKIAPQLPKSLLAQFGLQLQEAGYMEVKSTTLMDAPPEELANSFPIDPMQPIDLQRLYRLLMIFGDYYLGLETIVWKTWQKLTSNSPVRRDTGAHADVRKLSAKYLQGDREVSTEQLRKLVDNTRKLMGGLLGAIPAGAGAFLERFTAEFSPDKIAVLAKNDKAIQGWTEDAKCWNKFKKMMGNQEGQIFEEKMYEAIARQAESLILGTSRKDSGNPA